MKQYVGISRDHSGSMGSLRKKAMDDYNTNIEIIMDSSKEHDIDTVVSVVACGIGRPARNDMVVVNSSVNALKPLMNYEATGNRTPLFDSVGDLIEQFESLPDASNEEVSFLIMVITDGEDNSSQFWKAPRLREKMEQLRRTDRWTFTFRVPRGYKERLIRSFGIPEGNVIEWEQTERGMAQATQTQKESVKNFYANRAKGIRSTNTFYADLSGVSSMDIKQNMVDITKMVSTYNVTTITPDVIRPFVEDYLGYIYVKGTVYYQLTKSEKVQQHKDIIIFDKTAHKYYNGDSARDLLGLPKYMDIRLRPNMSDRYEIFVQSTSVNRKLIPGTQILMIRQ